MKQLKNRKFNIPIRIGDRYMLKEVADIHGIKSLTQLVLEVIRRECKYEVLDERDNPIVYTGGMLAVGEGEDFIQVKFPDGDEDFKLPGLLGLSVTLDEYRHIQESAYEHHFPGIPTFVRWLLESKGYISKKPVVSNSEITLEGGV